MDTTIVKEVRSGDSIAHAGRQAIESRVERGLDLYTLRGHEIQDLGDGIYAVPSQRGNTLYRVEYGETENCGCEDHKFNPHLSCKHLIACGVYHAKMQQRRRNLLHSFVVGEDE